MHPSIGSARESSYTARNPGEFMDYNCSYNGARSWMEKQARLKKLTAVCDQRYQGDAALATKMTTLSLESE